METVKGLYQFSLFFNADNGMAAFLVKPEEGTCQDRLHENGLIKAVGKFCLQQKNLPLSLEGEWTDTEYGPEFHFREAGVCQGSEKDAEAFLTDLGVMLTPLNVKKIVKAAGPDLFTASDDADIEEKICERTGADFVSVVEAFAKVRNLKAEHELFKFLDRYNGSYPQCLKLLRQYGDEALGILKGNPYQVLGETDIPFSLVDRIGLDNGVEPLSEARVQAIVLWCIKRETSAGNVYMGFNDLCRTASKTYGNVPATAIAAALKDHPDVVQDPDYPGIYYEAYMLRDEKLAAREFARIMLSRKALPFRPEFIGRIEEEQGRPFGKQQREAFRLLTSTGFKLLVGDPGTGKTTTVNGLLRYLEMLWDELYGHSPKFALCAPAGRAAQRMKEATGRNASTIHKLIEYQPYGGQEYYKDGSDPIDADVIVVDEVSMMGLSTFSKLAAAIKSGSLVLLVGDVNQLQSVEPGSVLQDIIRSRSVDMCHLTELFRQAAESGININAKKIINGDGDLAITDDFKVVRSEPGETRSKLVSIIGELMGEAGSPDRIQALSPVKKGSCGVNEGNAVIQDLFNPGKGGVWHGYKKNYRLHDRVIMQSNNYALGYFNGDVGYITHISESSMKIQIGEETITLPREQYGDMDLAYVCTVHKSQGSEYDYLIVVLQEEAGNMLDRNLFYTAVTRGKKKVVVLYEGDALNAAVRTERKMDRHSLLVERIQKEFAKYTQTHM